MRVRTPVWVAWLSLAALVASCAAPPVTPNGLQLVQRSTVSTPKAPSAATIEALGKVQAQLIRKWQPNCPVPEGERVQVRVRIRLNVDGALELAPQLVDYSGAEATKDLSTKEASLRAFSAIVEAAPFHGLPPEEYDSWKQFIVRFDSKEACH